MTSSTPAPTRTDRRRERTRAKLLAAGRELITDKGVAGLRIQEITERADVALGSFYNYFATKEELVEAVVTDSLDTLAGTIVDEATLDSDPAVTVSTAVRRVVRIAYDTPDFARLVLELSHADLLVIAAVEPHARTALQRGIDSGRFDVPDPDITLTGVAGGAMAIVDAILAGRHGEDADALYVEGVLRSIGIDADEARAIAHAPLD